MERGKPRINIKDKKLVLSDYKLIPAFLINKVVDLFNIYAEQSLECLVYINWVKEGEYIFTIPKQTVSIDTIKVDNQLDQINLLTGEVITTPLLKLGSIHSHHYMPPEFSYTDDLSDLNSGTGIHIVLGYYPKWEVNCSVVKNSKRYLVNMSNLLEELNSSINSSSLLINKVKNYISINNHE